MDAIVEAELTYLKGIGDANDIIVAESLSGERCSTAFEVLFQRKVKLKNGEVLSTANSSCGISVNGRPLEETYLVVKDDGFCSFPDGSSRPGSDVLAKMNLIPGMNAVHFEVQIRTPKEVHILKIDCFAYFFQAVSRFVVVDIDGTITKSDLPGLVLTLSPGILNPAVNCHSGICQLLNNIESHGFNILYLTSRPIVFATKTRAFLMSLTQESLCLPAGPLITCKLNTGTVVYREIIGKDMHIYKTAALTAVSDIFRKAGSDFPALVAGLGNRETDGMAYMLAGINRGGIFIINRNSVIQQYQESGQEKLCTTSTSTFQSYEDERFWNCLYGAMRAALVVEQTLVA
jgi:hypothetical protein